MEEPITPPATLEPHPYSQLFPLIDGVRLDELADDIRQNGLLTPILVFQGKVLDGRNRLRACEIAGVQARFEEFVGTEEEALARVLSANLFRRQLTEIQRAALGVSLVPIKAEFAARRMLAGVKIDPPVHGQEGAVHERGEAVELAAKDVGSSASSIRRALKIQEKAPDVIVAMRQGAVSSIPQAQALAWMPDAERKETLAAPPTERQRKLRERVRILKEGKKAIKAKPLPPPTNPSPPTEDEIDRAVEVLIAMMSRMTATKAKSIKATCEVRMLKTISGLVAKEKSKAVTKSQVSKPAKNRGKKVVRKAQFKSSEPGSEPNSLSVEGK